MPTTSTPRVPSAPSDGATKRVTTQGASGGTPDTPSSVGTDTWGGTWGGVGTRGFSWGRTWHSGALATPGDDPTGEKPAAAATPRVGAAPSGGATKRVTL